MNIQFASKSILYAVGFTLGAMSVSVFAESTEFRRGYEQGYHDGSEGRNPQYPQRGSTRRIVIDQARYGTRKASCNPKEKLQNAVNSSQNNRDSRRRDIVITANNALCGDPDRGHTKRLDVSYHCGNGPVLRVQAREGDTITLNCNGSNADNDHGDDNDHDRQQIVILEARYGSNTGGVFGGFLNKSCNPREKLQSVVNSAQNNRDGRRRDIVITANNALCGDPAPNFDKRLDLSYRCDNGPILSVRVDEGDRVTLSCENND